MSCLGAKGEAQLMLYNNDNGSSETLGDHHPAIGDRSRRCGARPATMLGSVLARACTGEPIYRDDIGVSLQRRGYGYAAVLIRDIQAYW